MVVTTKKFDERVKAIDERYEEIAKDYISLKNKVITLEDIVKEQAVIINNMQRNGVQTSGNLYSEWMFGKEEGDKK
jgi:hypothetical protein